MAHAQSKTGQLVVLVPEPMALKGLMLLHERYECVTADQLHAHPADSVCGVCAGLAGQLTQSWSAASH